MPESVAALIHVFNPSSSDEFDENGELLLGAYYQFIDKDNYPTGGLIGPYWDNIDAEKAAELAFKRQEG